jgi:hypothetical protein
LGIGTDMSKVCSKKFYCYYSRVFTFLRRHLIFQYGLK